MTFVRRVKILEQKLIFHENAILLNLTYSVNAVMYTEECLNLWASEHLQHFYPEACLGANSRFPYTLFIVQVGLYSQMIHQ